jgi:putative PIN family toxin of toxin-antitoxin system
VRLLLDTNVLVAALIARGVCADLLQHCIRDHAVVTSAPLLDEQQDVLTRKFHQRDTDVAAALRLFRQRFEAVTPTVLEPVCRDHDDDVVLGTALAGGCAAVITGDQDLLTLDPFRGIRILTPAAFWKWEAGIPPR